MKRKGIVGIFLLCALALSLTGALGETENEGGAIPQDVLTETQKTINWMWENPEATMVYERVHRYDQPFFYSPNEDGSDIRPMTLNEYRDMIWDQYALTREAFVDMDGDGSMEWVLKISVRGYDADWGYLILNYYEGQVYGRDLTYRAMMNLKADGTFEYADSAAAHGYAVMRLDGPVWETEPYTYYEPDGDGLQYYVDGEIAAAQEYEAASLRESAKAEPIWGAFNSVAWVERIDALESYQQALRDEIPVRYTSYYDGGEMNPVWREGTLKNLVTEEYGEGFSLTRFALIDLDMDELPEVVLEVTETTYYGFPFAFMVLKAENDGAVYAHEFVYRAMEDLKADGTFSYSSGALDSGFGRAWLHFARHGIVDITWSESSEDMETVYYHVNGAPATEAEFFAALARQDEKRPVHWYPLNDAVVNALPFLPW